MPTLLERDYGGLRVQVSYDGSDLTLTAETANGSRAVRIDPTAVQDAFNHPMLYVENPAELFKKGNQ